ncbi:hypothetical protein AB0I60_08525 [Actinosynnema sp. NPDC050436]|uniref:hypothetical protein n=1 Tax=Actinosynnema sp. NPDC050436 TaxID=3155659 RepID=UPI00340D266B
MPRRRLPVTLAVAAALTSTFAASPPGAVAAEAGAWRADLSIVDSDDVGVTSDGGSVRLDRSAPRPASARTAQRSGYLLLAPHDLAAPADTVAAAVRGHVPEGAEVAVDVRGALAGGQWTEWVEARPDAPAALPAVRTVQARLHLTAAAEQDASGERRPDGRRGPSGGQEPGASGEREVGRGPVVDEVVLTPSTTRPPGEPAGRRAAGIPPSGYSFRVFATREGLVGGTTANGHVITERDHFAALPSRRGLATKDTGTYTVQVCAANGRCEWAPVWDVGPWNTRDDHWNLADTREMWQDLPHGKPEAQAAHQDAYNGGKDQFGRQVANPAGIDLADGTFWDGLALTDNSWVTVTYLWTGTGPAGTVASGGLPLEVRDGPATTAPPVGLAVDKAQVRAECGITGEVVTGSQGTSDVWVRVAAGMYLAKVNLIGVPELPAC